MHFCVVHVCFFSSRSKVVKGVKRSNSFLNGQKKSTISNCKNNSTNVLGMAREEKVSTVTPSSDLPLRGQRSKFQTTSNCQNNSVNLLGMDRHAKVSMLTPSSDLSFRGQRSKKVKMFNYFK